MRKPLSTRAAVVMMALVLTAAVCGCSGPAGGGNITILVAWSGNELTAFQTVIRTFEKLNPGITVTVHPTRALTQQLGADLAEGDPPNAAALPSIGDIGQYINEGKLKPLDDLVNLADYGSPWSGLMRPLHNDQVYAVPVKADVKSLIWYDPTKLHPFSVPSTWPQLLALSNSIKRRGGSPWCLALSSPPTSGWPGTDWIADILLSTYGPRTYQQWVSGLLPWTSGPVLHAWQMWGQLVAGIGAVYGRRAVLTQQIESVNPYANGCYLAHGTLVDQHFLVNQNFLEHTNGQPELKFGTSYEFFPFPSSGAEGSGAIQVSADFIGMFKDTPPTRTLIQFLASTPAQQEWVSQPGADGFSADSHVPVSAYPDPLMQQIATLLTSGHHELCFGAADAMSPDLSAAFDHAILEYMADPAALTSTILPELAKVRPSSGNIPDVCGMSPTAPGRH